MNEEKKKSCLCQNYDKENDICSEHNIPECSKNDFEKCHNCPDYLIKENLVMF